MKESVKTISYSRLTAVIQIGPILFQNLLAFV